MMHADLEPITAAGLLVTDFCPARCRHCYVSSGPEGRRWMTVEAARGHFAALARLGVSAKGIHVGGGEPFGRGTQEDFARLLAIVRAAREAGLEGVGYVETGGARVSEGEARARKKGTGVFCRNGPSGAAHKILPSPFSMRERLAALADAGMRQLAISADPYHQEFIPPERVRLLYEAAVEALGPQGVRARRWAWLKAPEDVAAMAEEAREMLFTEHLRRYPERMTGRAAERLAALARRTALERIPEDGCSEALLESRHAHVDPDGWVYPGTCAGIALGRATRERPLDALLAAWRASDSPLLARLAAGGPRGMVEEAAALGWVPDPEGYAGKCHLCWSVRRHLVRAGAGREDLNPRAFYSVRDGT